jgi:hypothetical protein
VLSFFFKHLGVLLHLLALDFLGLTRGCRLLGGLLLVHGLLLLRVALGLHGIALLLDGILGGACRLAVMASSADIEAPSRKF